MFTSWHFSSKAAQTLAPPSTTSEPTLLTNALPLPCTHYSSSFPPFLIFLGWSWIGINPFRWHSAVTVILLLRWCAAVGYPIIHAGTSLITWQPDDEFELPHKHKTQLRFLCSLVWGYILHLILNHIIASLNTWRGLAGYNWRQVILIEAEHLHLCIPHI